MNVLERRLSHYIVKGMRKEKVITRPVENESSAGTPDLNWVYEGCEGWIELKRLGDWPKRPATRIRLDHYTKAQQAWGANQILSGGRWSLLVKVNNDYLLFTSTKGLLVGSLLSNKEWMFDNCCLHWNRRVDFEELVTCLLS